MLYTKNKSIKKWNWGTCGSNVVQFQFKTTNMLHAVTTLKYIDFL